MRESRHIELNTNNNQEKEKIINYKIIIWSVFLFLILTIGIFLILYVDYRNKENKNIINEFNKGVLSESKNNSDMQNIINLINTKKYDEAIIAIDKQIEQQPTAALYFYKGIAYLNSGRYEKCIDAYNKSIELNPNNIYAYLNKADCLADLENYKEAASVIDQALAIDPGNNILLNKRTIFESYIK